MTMLKRFVVRGVVFLASVSLLSACADLGAEETIVPRPDLLTAQEVGGGEQTPFKGGDLRVAADCGPDGTTYYPSPEGTRHGVQYVSDGRRIVLRLSDNPEIIRAYDPADIDRFARGDYCRMGRAYWGERADNQSTDWRVMPLDFGEGIAAFQAIEWHGKGLIPPPEPVLEEGGWVYAVARAYGIVDDTYIMVRIDLKNVSVEPPSEEELRALWDAQVAKVRYFKAIEHAEETLTPQSGQESDK